MSLLRKFTRAGAPVTSARWVRECGVAALLLIVTATVGACTARAPRPAATAAANATPSPSAGPGSVAVVCEALRRAMSADMTPFGTALGAVVGSSVADDGDRRDEALEQVDATLHKISADVTTAGAPATDQALRAAVAETARRVSALATDATFLSDVRTMNDIPSVTAKLTQAVTPIATACDHP